jgi:type I restriction enzyme S subunit
MTTTIVSRLVVEELANWQVLTLRQAGISLIDCEHRTPPAANDGFPYVAIPQIKNGRLDLSDARKITKEHFGEWTKKARPQGFDVILSRRCNPGETAFVPHGLDCALGQNLVLLRADGSRVYPPFLRWLVRGPEWWAQIGKYINVGAIFDSLKCADVPNFPLSIPPLPEQRRIAEILGTLDDKIELNRRMNETLESMAQALFQSWFIDFDPVHANLDNRQPLGLDPATAALFPNKFQESKLGHIPLGWKVGRLDDLCTLKRGHDLPTTSRTAGEVPVISSSGISGTHCEAKACGPGVVTGRYGTIGKVFFVETDYWPLNTTLYVEDFKDSPSRFIFHVLGQIDYSMYTDKAAVPGVNRNHLHEEPTIIPPMGVRQKFAGIVAPLWAQHAAYQRQSSTLSTLRDTLLPKLLSGDSRVTLSSEDNP